MDHPGFNDLPLESRGFTCERTTDDGTLRPNRHLGIQVCMPTNGSIKIAIAGRDERTVHAGEIGLFCGIMPHRIITNGVAKSFYSMTLPLGWFLTSGFPEPFVHSLLNDGVLITPIAPGSDQLRFEQWDADLRSSARWREEATLLEVLARMIRIAHPWLESEILQATERGLSAADQLLCYILQNQQKPLSSESVAEAHGLSPTTASRLLNDAFGTSMDEVVRQVKAK